MFYLARCWGFDGLKKAHKKQIRANLQRISTEYQASSTDAIQVTTSALIVLFLVPQDVPVHS